MLLLLLLLVVVIIMLFSCSNLNQHPENIQLPNLDALNRSSGLYAVIPADLPPRVPPMRCGSVPLKEECIQNTHFQVGHHRNISSTSSRYGPAPDHPDQVMETDYAQIDKERRGRIPRLPSDYEMVLVRNRGLVPTEDSHPLSPARVSRSSQNGGRGEEEEEEEGRERQMMKLLMSDLPPVSPSLTNDYEIISNLHFKSEGGSAPDDLGGQTPFPSGIEVIKNASYGEIPGITRARALSEANNPMYSTNPTQRGGKRLKPEVMTIHNSEYDVPPLETNPDTPRQHRVGNQSNSIPGHVTGQEMANSTSLLLSNNPGYTYDVPPPRERASTEGVNNYNIPRDITSTQRVNVTYDVPKPQTIPTPRHPNFVTLEILSEKSPPRIVSESKQPPAYYKYDVPPSNLPAPKLDT